MTICNMSIEAGARAGMVAPDETTYAYLKGRPHAPKGADWDAAVAALTSGGGTSPDWASDGARLAFVNASKIYVMNADGSNQRRLPIDINIKYGYAQEQMVSWGK